MLINDMLFYTFITQHYNEYKDKIMRRGPAFPPCPQNFRFPRRNTEGTEANVLLLPILFLFSIISSIYG
jgi:hypothetical protein